MADDRSSAERWLRLARNPLIGVALAVIGIVVLAFSGRHVWSESRDAFASASLSYVALASVAFAAATVSLALSISFLVDRGRVMWFGAMASQLLKYIPGSVWQTAFLYSDAMFRGVGVYVGVTLFAAATALALSAVPVLVIPAALVMVTLFTLGARSIGFGRVSVAASLAGLSGGFVLVSGLLTAAAIGSDLQLGRELATVWGIGVLAIPVPAGLGVREGAIALLSTSDPGTVLAVATLHRLATTVADGCVGAFGLWGRRWTRMSARGT